MLTGKIMKRNKWHLHKSASPLLREGTCWVTGCRFSAITFRITILGSRFNRRIKTIGSPVFNFLRHYFVAIGHIEDIKIRPAKTNIGALKLERGNGNMAFTLPSWSIIWMPILEATNTLPAGIAFKPVAPGIFVCVELQPTIVLF